MCARGHLASPCHSQSTDRSSPPRTLCLVVSGSTSPGRLPNSRLLPRGPFAGSSVSPQTSPREGQPCSPHPFYCCLHSCPSVFLLHGLKRQPLVDDFSTHVSSQMSPWCFPSGFSPGVLQASVFIAAKSRLSTSQPLLGDGIVPLAQTPLK